MSTASIINTTFGPRDESLLIKHAGSIDNDNERTEIVEYCLMGCTGPAHTTNQPDSDMYFCSQHVHRSVSVALKRVAFSESEVGVIG
jgi:hypothetical protein